jgi:O-antigen biosynthesis protein
MQQSNFILARGVWGPDWDPIGLGNSGGTISPFFLRQKLLGDNINVQNYRHLVSSMSRRIQPNYLRFPCVTPSWDNSLWHRRRGTVLIEWSLKSFIKWLVATLANPAKYTNTPRIMFVNAWNEWGEGNHLEPDQKWSRAYLNELRSALEDFNHDA